MVGRILKHGVICVALLVAMTACDNTDQQARALIRFDEPVRYRIVQGDTLATIAEKYAVQVEDLVAWNGLDPDAVEAGEVLLIWRTPDEEVLEEEPTLVAQADRPTPRPKRRRSTPQARQTRPTPRAAPRVTLPAEGRPTSVRNAGLFGAGMGDEGLNDGLADAVASLEHDRRSVGNAGLREGTDMRSGEVERSGAMGRVAKPPPRTGPYFPDTPVRTPAVSRPAAKRCLTQRTSANTGDDGMYAGRGVSSAAIRTALSRPLSTSRRCMPPGTEGDFTITVEIKVGCDGRVANVYPINAGFVPKRILDCVGTVLSSASFPAHDLPDGQSFQYPISYRF